MPMFDISIGQHSWINLLFEHANRFIIPSFSHIIEIIVGYIQSHLQ